MPVRKATRQRRFGDATIQLLIDTLSRIEGMVLGVSATQATHSEKMQKLELDIATLAAKPRLESLEEFKKTWEPRLIIGFFGVGLVGAGIALLIKSWLHSQ